MLKTPAMVANVLALTATTLVMTACDPIRRVTVSRPIPKAIERTCVTETLRADKTIRVVDVSYPNRTWAELEIPSHLGAPRRDGYTGFFVEEHNNDKGELEITFWTSWLGPDGSREYRAYVEKTLQGLRDRTIERCSGR